LIGFACSKPFLFAMKGTAAMCIDWNYERKRGFGGSLN